MTLFFGQNIKKKTIYPSQRFYAAFGLILLQHISTPFEIPCEKRFLKIEYSFV
ncbi:hypothetical protein TEH_04560 [Tetragenococcus halophilus NBRC 12172]|uniref:Uncharacterized protein n=1 Tax=Tetragenococcus halophilus (strain DSM 20338 / JCM 20259 / NCIMB 9735 / NBRC 12172) TaxID=945021 RepID=A0AAN1VQA0_TETHN|nr:hypothetical protein TEH_04560 [Tetragenococcus halophilus NBRC 12172]